jgi:hypothetical protein
LFAGGAAAEDPVSPTWHWLAPAMAMCLLALMMVGNSFPRAYYGGTSLPSNLVATVAMDGPQMGSYYLACQSDHNAFPFATFEWTKGGNSLTSAAQFSDSDTNVTKP